MCKDTKTRLHLKRQAKGRTCKCSEIVNCYTQTSKFSFEALVNSLIIMLTLLKTSLFLGVILLKLCTVD